jgi:hypothetical protein
MIGRGSTRGSAIDWSHAVFRPRVRQLDPTAWVAEPEGSTESEPA